VRPRRPAKLAVRAAAFVILLLILGLLALPYAGPWFIFRPAPLARVDPAHWGLPAARPVVFPTADGSRLVGWWTEAADPSAPVVLLLHGRSGNISTRAGIAGRLAAHGYGILLVDYRGYGASQGRPSEQGLNEDGAAAYGWLRARGIAPGRIVIVGQSLGNAPAAWLAARKPAVALVLVSPFTTLPDAAGDRLGLPLRWLPWPRNRFDVGASVRRVRAPLLLVASANDGTVPLANAERLAALRPGHVVWLREDGLSHGGLLAGSVASGRFEEALDHLLAAPTQ
jgi:uncharacterized protein